MAHIWAVNSRRLSIVLDFISVHPSNDCIYLALNYIKELSLPLHMFIECTVLEVYERYTRRDPHVVGIVEAFLGWVNVGYL